MIRAQEAFVLFIVNNFFCFILLFIILFACKKIIRHDTALRVFRNAIEVLLIMITLDSLYLACAFGVIKNAPLEVAYVFKSLYFIFGLITGYLWFVFLEVILKTKISVYKPYILLSSVVAIIGIILVIVNRFFLCGIFKNGADYIIPWENIQLIGEDAVIISCKTPEPRKNVKKRLFFWKN